MSELTQRISEEIRQKKKELIVVNKARKLEQDKIDSGWRYINFYPNMSILVPCDKNGTPTKEGVRRISERKKSLNLL